MSSLVRSVLSALLTALPLFALCFTLSAEAGSGLTQQELRGQQIFNTGIGSDTITVLSGVSDIRLPARSMPCARCHGEDGVGLPVGGLVPSLITWPHLVQVSGHLHHNGRQHPPFTETTLARLIRSGIDPAGNRLEPAMPRFLMSQEDMASLIAYLKRLQWLPDPGMATGRLHIGTLLPRQGPLAALGKEIEDILQASCDLINRAGGVHGRLLKLEVADYTGQPEADLKTLERLMSDEVFALLSPFVSGIEQQSLDLAEQKRVPVIAPFTQAGGLELPQGRYSFHLFGGIREQTRALVEFVAASLAEARVNAVVLRPTGRFDDLAAVAGEQAVAHGWEVADTAYPAASVDWNVEVRKLREVRRSLVLFYGAGEELVAFLQAADAQSWRPLVLTFGSLAGRAVLDMPKAFADRLVLSYRSPPLPVSNEKSQEFLRLRHGSDSPTGYMPPQIAAYSATRLLEEALYQSGRSADRESLVEVLEGMQGFESGTVPRLSFAADRRVGAPGAHLAMLDLEQGGLRSVSLWQSLDPEPETPAPALPDKPIFVPEGMLRR